MKKYIFLALAAVLILLLFRKRGASLYGAGVVTTRQGGLLGQTGPQTVSVPPVSAGLTAGARFGMAFLPQKPQGGTTGMKSDLIGSVNAGIVNVLNSAQRSVGV